MQHSSKRGTGIVSDFTLWEEVRKTAVPLHPRPTGTAAGKPPREVRSPAGGAAPTVPRTAAQKRRATPVPAPAPRYELSGLDRRTAQRLARGKLIVEASIDLHGYGAEEARHRLLRFLAAARSRDQRTILVITGKGASPYSSSTLHGRAHFHAPERQGRLRRLFTQWLVEAEFRQHVSGFQPAHPKHGGGGAFYVRLRRPARHDP